MAVRSSSPEPPQQRPRVVAVAAVVTDLMKEHRSDRQHAKTIVKLEVIFAKLGLVILGLQGKTVDIEEAESVLYGRPFYRKKIGPLLELGLDSTGGTMRIFVLVEKKSYFFLNACIKKSNDGAESVIKESRKKADEIKEWYSNFARIKKRDPTAHEIGAMLGTKYQVSEIPY